MTNKMFHSQKAKYPNVNKRFTKNKSFTVPNGGKLIIVSLLIRLFRRAKYPKINNSFETIIRQTRVISKFWFTFSQMYEEKHQQLEQ